MSTFTAKLLHGRETRREKERGRQQRGFAGLGIRHGRVFTLRLRLFDLKELKVERLGMMSFSVILHIYLVNIHPTPPSGWKNVITRMYGMGIKIWHSKVKMAKSVERENFLQRIANGNFDTFPFKVLKLRFFSFKMMVPGGG